MAVTQVSRFGAASAIASASSGSPGQSKGMRHIPRGSSSLVNRPARRGWAVTTNSTVVAQWLSRMTTVSWSRVSKTSRRSCSRPGTRVKSSPPLSSRRVCSGSMIVGTCASRPAPTISPMRPPSPVPSARCEDAVLDVAVEVEAPCAALAADAAVPVATERRREVADEEAVHPDRAGVQPGTDPLGTLRIAGDEGRRETVLGVVGHRDPLLLGAEGLEREDRAEDLSADDLARRVDALDDGREVVEAARARVELAVRPAAEDDPRALLPGPLDESVDALEVGVGDERADGGAFVTRVALAVRELPRLRQEPLP